MNPVSVLFLAFSAQFDPSIKDQLRGTDILKHLNLDEFRSYVEELMQGAWTNNFDTKLLGDAFQRYVPPHKISLPDNFGFILVEPNELIRLEADNAYTHVFTTTRKKQTLAKSLKYFEGLLAQHGFFRTHKSHLINLHHIQSFSKLHGAHVVMSDGVEIPISRRKVADFLQWIHRG